MHDIGSHISYARHHKHSYYLIKHGDLRGFSPEEIEVMALVARYHRRGTPRRRDEAYGELGTSARRAVRTLASILRVAECLDRSHSQVISNLEIVDEPDGVILRVSTGGDAELEAWATDRHLAPFARLVGKPVRIELATSAGANQKPARKQRRATLEQVVNTELTARKPRRNR
jgi:exopolyphosphatase/guanosine-5'-triphosphate,3'-diphosphate pyrophosphatase